MIEMHDPIALFDEAQKAQKDALKLEARFSRLTRKLFTAETGKEWLRLALARHNFMGSVFDPEMNTHRAAYNDGVRSVFSDILNSAASGIRQAPAQDDDD